MGQAHLLDVKRVRQMLADLAVVRESGDGLVAVTVGSFGELRDLYLDPRIGRDRDADALAAKIIRTHHDAAAAVAEEASIATAVLLPGYAGRRDVDLAFDPMLYELDVLINAPQQSSTDGRPVLGDNIDYRGLRQYVQDLRDGVRDIQETAESDDGLVAVTVGGHGELVGLALDWRVYRIGTTSQLAEDIVDTSHRATIRVGERLNEIGMSTTSGRWA